MERFVEKKEATKGPDWTALIRNSYLFSQGDPALQRQLLVWILNGPLSEVPLPDDAWQAGVGKFVTAIEHKHHVSFEKGDLGGGMDADLRARASDLKSIYDARKERTSEDQAQVREESLRKAARLMINKDLEYSSYGRNFKEDRRDVHSSFTIDFGILHKGDGFFTWKGLPSEFQQFWEEVMPYVKEAAHEQDFQTVLEHYLEHHPQLSEEDRAKIQEFLSEVSGNPV